MRNLPGKLCTEHHTRF